MEFQAEYGISMPWPLDVARWLAPASLSYAAVKALLAVMRRRIQLWKIQGLRGHAIVYGLCEESLLTIESLRKADIATVVITTNLEQSGRLAACGAYVIEITAADEQALKLANIKHASYLLAATNSDSENTTFAYRAYQLHRKNTQYCPINCAVYIHSANVANALYDQDVFRKDYENFTAHIINYNQLSARLMLAEYGPEIWLPNLLSTTTGQRILAIGDHPLIHELVVRFGGLGFYGAEEKLNIQLMGKNASRQLINLKNTRPNLAQLVELTANDIEPTALNTGFEKAIADFNPDIIYLCAATPEQSLVWCHALNNIALAVPIVVTELNSSFMLQVMEQENNEKSSIHYIHLLEQSCTYQYVFNTQHDLLAKAIHDNYINCQKQLGDTPTSNSSLIDWKQLFETLKDANRNQADHLLIKCRLLTGKKINRAEEVEKQLNADNIEKLARVEHERWLAEKLLSGWRYTDGEKNTHLRLSPSLIPWAQLSESEKQKDRDTIVNMPALIKLLP